jgi:hypothetical protein
VGEPYLESRARVGRSAFSSKKKNKKTGEAKIKSCQGRAECFLRAQKNGRTDKTSQFFFEATKQVSSFLPAFCSLKI